MKTSTKINKLENFIITFSSIRLVLTNTNTNKICFTIFIISNFYSLSKKKLWIKVRDKKNIPIKLKKSNFFLWYLVKKKINKISDEKFTIELPKIKEITYVIKIIEVKIE